MKKFVAIIIILSIAFAVPVLCAAIGLADAHAEADFVEYYGVVDDTHIAIFKDEVCWKTDVVVVKTGEVFSYYDDIKLRLGTPLKIKVFNGDEVIDVEYLHDSKELITTVLGITALLSIIVCGTRKIGKRIQY